jgi:hypothetical protein
VALCVASGNRLVASMIGGAAGTFLGLFMAALAAYDRSRWAARAKAPGEKQPTIPVAPGRQGRARG